MRIGPTAEQPRPDTPKPMTMKQLKFVLLTLVFPLLLSCSNDTLDSPEGAGGTSKKNVTHINGTDIAPETTLRSDLRRGERGRNSRCRCQRWLRLHDDRCERRLPAGAR